MIFFPLAIVVGVVVARRGHLVWAMAAGTALFALAVLVAWQVQGFPPSARDLAWLAVVLAATSASSRYGRRRRAPGRPDATAAGPVHTGSTRDAQGRTGSDGRATGSA